MTQDLAALVAKLRHADEYEPLGHDGWEAADALEAQAAEIARLTQLFDLSQKTTEAVLDRAEKAEAALAEVREETIRLNKATDADYAKRLSESRAAEEGAMMILAQTIAERDAARKALTESQALLAMWPEVAEYHLTEYELQVLIGTSISGCNMAPDRVFSLPMAWHRLHAIGLIDRTDGLAVITDAGRKVLDGIFKRTPAEAQAALDARINAAKEEGRIAGLREAAVICVVDDTAWDWDECRAAILAKIKEAENG